MIEINTAGYLTFILVAITSLVAVSEYNRGPFGKFILWLLWDFSGIRWIWEKVSPPAEVPKGTKPPSTFLLWATGLFGLYIAIFGLASQRYENRVDLIETRINGIYAQLATENYKKALSRIPRVQRMRVPAKPVLLEPSTVYRSLFVDKLHKDTVEQMKEIVEDWKSSFEGVDLIGANLENIDLRRANLSNVRFIGANIRNATLSEAILKSAMLWDADLTKAYIVNANLEGANLTYANLEDANLYGANLRKAFLYGANFNRTRLEKADLSGADLREPFHEDRDVSEIVALYGFGYLKNNIVRNISPRHLILLSEYRITIKQLCSSASLWNVKLDEALEAEVNKQCPHLLEKPDWIKD